MGSRGLDVVGAAIDRLSRAVADHPRTLMHRDFMPWNVHFREGGRIAVIDFQDALVGSHAYDLVSLLHDRDTDFALGWPACRAVVEHFRLGRGLPPSFWNHYREALLQRYMRLAGQFRLLARDRGRPVYEGWVPGCLRRIGKALAGFPGYEEALRVLTEAIPEIAEGAGEPWSFDA